MKHASVSAARSPQRGRQAGQLRQVRRYVVIGAAAYVLEMAVLVLCSTVLGWADVASVALSFWVGLVASFVLQKIVAFENHERQPKRVLRQMVLFGLLVAWNYIFTLAAVAVFGQYASVVIIRTICMALIICWNFILYSTYIFNSHEQTNKHRIR